MVPAMLVLGSCDREPDDHCSDDPEPLAYCADFHVTLDPDANHWVCYAKTCAETDVPEDGCRLLEHAINNQILPGDKCLATWPMADSGTTSGGGTQGTSSMTSAGSATVATGMDLSGSSETGNSGGDLTSANVTGELPTSDESGTTDTTTGSDKTGTDTTDITTTESGSTGTDTTDTDDCTNAGEIKCGDD